MNTRAKRGGGWNYFVFVTYVRVAPRIRNIPGYAYSNLGFRLARTPKPKLKTIRGGCWGNDASHLQAVNRDGDLPAERDDLMGFRLTRSSNSNNLE